jgi:hypothetical protein
MDFLIHLIQIIYWLALATWFGGVLFVAVAAPIIFRTVREANPVLPGVLSVNLENQHGTLLAGSIVGNLLSTLLRVELVCAGALLIPLVAHWFLLDLSGPNIIFPIVRCALYLAAVVLVIYDWRSVWPKVWRYRQQYIDHADEPEVANPAKDQFDRYHGESVRILSIVLALLLGIILFSGNIRLSQAITFTFGSN